MKQPVHPHAEARQSERDRLAADIDARMARGVPVSQAEFDKLAALFEDDDVEELVPPDPPPGVPSLDRMPHGLAGLLKDVFAELEGKQHKKR